jgi:hypothetical protein
MYPLTETEREHERQMAEQRQAKRLAHAVAQIPAKSRETIVGRLQDQGKDPTDELVLAEWQQWRHWVRDQDDESWTPIRGRTRP